MKTPVDVDAQAAPIAYSYIRFSTPEQAGGDSLRRQTAAAAAWCERHSVRLDESTTLHDLGKSAYLGGHRKNPDRHSLAAFLKLVEVGKIPRGSYLIIENLDRLSREEERPALRLWMDLLDAGVNIVQLHPETIFKHEQSDMFDIMRAVMELSRGHGESAIKSERVGAAWAQKKKKARAEGAFMTRRLPGWVEECGGKLRLIPTAAATVKRIFQLAIAGYGQTRIVRQLSNDGTPTMGGSGRWIRSYIHAILTDRRALGELQPRKRADGSDDGPPIPNYFPAVVTEKEWLAASAARSKRKLDTAAPRIGKYVNLFAGMMRNARDGGTYYAGSRLDCGRWQRVLLNTRGGEGAGKFCSFDFQTFETAVLRLLKEVDPREITGDKNDGPDVAMVLSGELAGVEASIAALETDLEAHGDSPALFRRLRAKEDQKRGINAKLAEARLKAVSPLSEAWGETQTLAEALEKAPDRAEARLRLRSLLRRVVDEIWILIVPMGRIRLAAVQIWFTGDVCRDYLIRRRSPVGNRYGGAPAEWYAKSLFTSLPGAGELDLREREHAAELEARLLAVKLDGPAGE